MQKQLTLKPVDVAVALRLVDGAATFDVLGRDLGVSPSTVYEAVGRLEAAGLLRPGTRIVNGAAMLEFLEHGVRYAFPARPGGLTRGVATAHASPGLADDFVFEDAAVWPSAAGSTRGFAVTPLYPQAVELPERAPRVYERLGLVDAIRIGRARERRLAVERLHQSFAASTAGV